MYIFLYIYGSSERRITSLDQMHRAVVLRGMGMMSGGAGDGQHVTAAIFTVSKQEAEGQITPTRV